MATVLIKHMIPQIGRILRLYREKRGQNLSDVAERAGISVSMLSQIERGRVSPSIDTLLRVCDALNFDVVDLFRRISRRKDVLIMHRGERLRTGGHGVIYEQLITSPESTFPAELFLLQVAPGADSGLSPGSHEGIEIGYVLQGSAVLAVGGKEYSLSDGDSFSFYSQAPHKLTNTEERGFVAVWGAIPPHTDYLELDQIEAEPLIQKDGNNGD
jgi:transcriptional regulator with XRE-family HTH domain